MALTRRMLLGIGVLSSGLALTGCVRPTSRPNVRAEVKESIEAFRTAMVGADIATLSALADDRLSFGHSNGVIQTKQELIDTVQERREIFKSIELSEARLQLSGNVAMQRHRFVSDIVLEGRDISVDLKVLEVWRNTDRWRLLARQAFRT